MAAIKDVLVITTGEPAGLKIKAHIKPVSAHVVAGTNVFSDFLGGMSDIFGGRSHSYQKQLVSLYNEAVENIKYEAFKIGGNCVVGLKIDIDEISGNGKSMFMITAIGTAVKLEEEYHHKAEAPVGWVGYDQVLRLEKLKSIQSLNRQGELILNQDVWDFITTEKVDEVYFTIVEKLVLVIENKGSYLDDAINSFYNNTANYFSSIDSELRMELFFKSLSDVDLHLKAKIFIVDMIKKNNWVDLEKVKQLLESNEIKAQKIALELLSAEKPSYSPQDLVTYDQILELIGNNFKERGSLVSKKQFLSSKEKPLWECECGYTNEIDLTYCGKCYNDIYGFGKFDANPNKVKGKIKSKVALISELLN